MAEAARPAHPAGPSLRPVVAVLTLGLALMPRPVHAEPAPAGRAQASEPAPPAGATSPAEAVDEPPDADDGGEGEAVDDATDDAREGEAVDDATDDEGAADDAAAADDDAADDADAADDDAAPSKLGPTAEPLRPLQTAAWWTMFGAFAVGTTAGVLAGLAERQEDRATRLSTLFDAQTGAQPRYVDRQDEYEQYLRRGEGYAKAAIGVGVVAGVATVAAIALFAVDARRQRGGAAPKERRAALRVRGGGMEVRF